MTDASLCMTDVVTAKYLLIVFLQILVSEIKHIASLKEGLDVMVVVMKVSTSSPFDVLKIKCGMKYIFIPSTFSSMGMMMLC